MKSLCLVPCLMLAFIAVNARSAQRRFMLMPDGDGRLHLVDLLRTEPTPRIDPNTDVTLRLYTKSNPTSPQVIKVGVDSTLGHFNPSKPIRVVIHGWNSSGQKMDGFRVAYLTKDVNIIIVDWSGPASKLYTSAKTSSKEVGVHVGDLLKYLVTKGASMSNMHLVGHSLGAHAVGVAGDRAGGTVAMITGSDPAAPLFSEGDRDSRLDSTDGKFVQVIHTCAGLLGWKDPMGHVDFYPNGGNIIQPGCGIDLGGACSHGRSNDFFIESITTTKAFKSVHCSSWNDFQAGKCNSNPSENMGENTRSSAKGTYYLKTASSSPFALG